MGANSIGHTFTLTTFGESHGLAIGAVLDGCPSGLALCEADIQVELDRRRPGQSHVTTQRQESDCVLILSGVFEGFTTGAPIGLLIENQDAKSKDYEEIKDIFRPGHGDYTYFKKYGNRDYRGGGRSSARETALRVAAGAIAKKWLKEFFNVEIRGYLAEIGPLKIDKDQFDWNEVERNDFFCPDAQLVPGLEALIRTIRKEGDSIGSKVCVEATHVPVGIGEPIYDKLDADLAKAFMSINAVKGVEIGDGFAVVNQKGSEHRDEMIATGFLSNHAGGILAGIATGQSVFASLAIKPASSILKPGRSLDIQGQEVMVETKGRHDPCVGIRAVPVAEAMMAIVLMDHCLRYFGYKDLREG